MRQDQSTRPPAAAGSRTVVASLGIALLAAHLPAQQTPAAERGGRRAQPVRVLKVGTVHPVSGPAFRNGVIVMRGPLIRAVGKAGEVAIPAGAQVMDFPDGHAYPGLVDAMSRAFGDAKVLQDSSADAGTEIYAGLDGTDEVSRTLVYWGVTTAYVSNRASSSWRGMGSILHPRKDGFRGARNGDATAAAVQMRISAGSANTHPLARQKALRSVSKTFKAVEGYKKKKEEHEKALEKYAKDYEAYLEHFRKKSGKTKKDKGDKGSAKPATSGDSKGKSSRDPRSSRRSRRGGPPPGSGEKKGEKKEAEKPKTEEAQGKKGSSAATKSKSAPTKGAPSSAKSKAPKKPSYPKRPKPSPANEALLKVTEGKLPLRVEARGRDEILAALKMARDSKIPRMVLEVASDGAAVAKEIADAGVPVVTAGFPPTGGREGEYEDAAELAGKLSAAGVAVAIASDSVREARYLPLLAAYACGKGMDRDAAVAAITLVPAKILGMQKQIGSLEPGKRADILVTSSPLLASDARIVAVLSGGESQFGGGQ